MNAIELVRTVERGHIDWISFLETLPTERLTVPGVAGEWSVKDMISHIAWYEWWLAEFITTRTWPVLPAHLNHENTDTRNNAYFEDQRETPLDEVLANEQESHRALVSALAGLSDAEIADQTLLSMPPGPVWNVTRQVAACTTEHYTAHTLMIQEWLKATTL